MKYVFTGSRLLLGLLFLVFGLNGFFNFLPQPPMPEKALALAMAFGQTGYMWPLIKGTEVIAGLLLLSGFFVPLALVFLAPVVVNIVLFHIFLEDGAGLALPLILVVLGVLTAWSRKEDFKSVLSAK